MNVADLLSKLPAIYPRFDGPVAEASSSAYYKALRPYEGESLASAWEQVFAKFRPKANQPYPLAADFLDILGPPPFKIDLGTPSHKQAMADHARVKAHLLEEWEGGQAKKIAEAHGKLVYGSCRLFIQDFADREAWLQNPKRLLLTEDEIAVCEARVVSSNRMGRFRAFSLNQADDVRWSGEMAEIRKILADGGDPLDAPDVTAKRRGIRAIVAEQLADESAAYADLPEEVGDWTQAEQGEQRADDHA